jgi:hypothetical protein
VTGNSKKTDLLLINATNLLYEPFYPYAFVMLTALAERCGISVQRLELSNIREENRGFWLRRAIETCRPRALGFTLRQTDSYYFEDYLHGGRGLDPYYPVAMLSSVLKKVRAMVELPIVVGGYGYSVHAMEISEYLQIDYGIRGSADAFFENFDAILRGKDLSAVPNLVYRKNGRYHETPLDFHPPFPGREYGEEITDEIVSHYGRIICHGNANLTLHNSCGPVAMGADSRGNRSYAFRSQMPTIAVEISRGCPFDCYFCSEPLVKGRKIRYRSPDLIEEEISYLASKSLRRFWFVCSELNPGGADFALDLAERMIRLNEKLADYPLSWTSYHLPKWLSRKELRLLYRSGFTTTWNDVVSLDDRQLEKACVPYRSGDAIRFFEDDFAVRSEMGLPPLSLSLFLGDVFLTPDSLRRTLTAYMENGLRGKCDGGKVVKGIRVFDFRRNHVSETEVVTFTPAGETKKSLIHPSFHVPSELFSDLGNLTAVDAFFDHVCATYLSGRSAETRDWCWFLARHTGPEPLSAFLSALSGAPWREAFFTGAFFEAGQGEREKAASLWEQADGKALRPILYPSGEEKEDASRAASLLLLRLCDGYWEKMTGILESLRLPVEAHRLFALSEYELALRLSGRFKDAGALLEAVRSGFGLGEASVEELIVSYLLYRFNVTLGHVYDKWLFGAGDIG